MKYEGTYISQRVRGRFARNPVASLLLFWSLGARWDLYVRARGAPEKRVRAAHRLAQVSAFLRVNVTGDAVVSVLGWVFLSKICLDTF